MTAGLLLCAVLRQPGDDKRKVTMELMMSGLKNMHFSPLELNDSLSGRVYKMFMKRIDGKNFYTKEDMAKISQYQYKIDDEIGAGTFEFYDLASSILNKRIAEDSNFTKEVLSKPFNFSTDENIELDPGKQDYAKDDDALHDRWRRDIKYQVMVRLADMMNEQEKRQEKKDTSLKVVKTIDQMEKEVRDKVAKDYKTRFGNFAKETEETRLSMYFECIANAFDPHTDFFAPEERKSFDINISGQLEGIGAQLVDESGNITIDKVIPGSPAWKSGEIKDGDVITKVAQDTGEAVNIQGMLLEKAIQLIRGKKGTVVRLTIRKPDGSSKQVVLIRDVINLNEKYAHDAVIEENGKKMGYIRLPEFYTDFERTGSPTCAADVKKELQELNAEHVQGIIIDLRDNGGGSLPDVVKMVGLFVHTGPIVQVKGRDQHPQMMSDYDTSVVYSGPLIVLVNGASASASEIFAAAIQDYRRGIIMGSQTYGKGTVQQVFNLDDYVNSQFKDLAPLGSVKITTSKFYRINGSTTQRDGVTPDIPMPDAYQYVYEKERDEDFPVKSDKISPAPYNTWNNPPDIQKLQENFDKRTENDSIIQLIREEAVQIKKQRDNTLVTLNLGEYRKQEKERIDGNKKYEAITKPIPGIVIAAPDHTPIAQKYNEGKNESQMASGSETYTIYPTGQEVQHMKADTNEVAVENARLKLLTKDIEFFQALHVINEMR